MKKIAVLSVAALLALAAFASCDSGTKYVTAHSIFDGTSLTLPIEFDSANSGGSFTYFTSRKSLPELKEELEGAEGFSVVSIQLYEQTVDTQPAFREEGLVEDRELCQALTTAIKEKLTQKTDTEDGTDN